MILPIPLSLMRFIGFGKTLSTVPHAESKQNRLKTASNIREYSRRDSRPDNRRFSCSLFANNSARPAQSFSDYHPISCNHQGLRHTNFRSSISTYIPKPRLHNSDFRLPPYIRRNPDNRTNRIFYRLSFSNRRLLRLKKFFRPSVYPSSFFSF